MSDLRAESRKRWNAQAAGWSQHADRLARVFMPVAEWMLDHARLQPGHTVLELAAGTGDVGFLAAELVQPGGQLITSDFSPEMLTAAQQRAEQLGLEGVRFKQIDAESIDLDAASVDVVLCRWGYMLMADPGAALRETRRVLRPGGRVTLAAWRSREENPFFETLGSELEARGLFEAPDPDTPGPFTFAEPGDIERRLHDAGFVDGIEVDTVELPFEFPSVGAWFDVQTRMSAMMGAAARNADRDEIVAGMARRADQYVDADGRVTLPARTWVAAATA